MTMPDGVVETAAGRQDRGALRAQARAPGRAGLDRPHRARRADSLVGRRPGGPGARRPFHDGVAERGRRGQPCRDGGHHHRARSAAAARDDRRHARGPALRAVPRRRRDPCSGSPARSTSPTSSGPRSWPAGTSTSMPSRVRWTAGPPIWWSCPAGSRSTSATRPARLSRGDAKRVAPRGRRPRSGRRGPPAGCRTRARPRAGRMPPCSPSFVSSGSSIRLSGTKRSPS